MTIKELVKYLATHEGRKHQASVGDIREIVGILSDLVWRDWHEYEFESKMLTSLMRNGWKRAKRKSVRKEL